MLKLNAAERILGMSKTKPEAEKMIGALDEAFAEHVMKIYIFNKSPYIKGWADELETWYTRIARVGSNLKKGRKLDSAAYMDCLGAPALLNPEHNLPVAIKTYIRRNPEAKARDDLEVAKMFKALQEFYNFLCASLEEGKYWIDIEEKILHFLA